MRQISIAIILLLTQLTARGEVYQGIQPLSTLAMVKQQFPNAVWTKNNAAWVTENEAFYTMSGSGIAGEIRIAFTDDRPRYRKRYEANEAVLTTLRENAAKKLSDEGIARLEQQSLAYNTLAKESDDDALQVNWVRWVPSNEIPLARYVTKFGKPNKSGFGDDDMQPYVTWTKLGVSLTLSDDGKLVLKADYTFTPAEFNSSCRKFYGKEAVCNF